MGGKESNKQTNIKNLRTLSYTLNAKWKPVSDKVNNLADQSLCCPHEVTKSPQLHVHIEL